MRFLALLPLFFVLSCARVEQSKAPSEKEFEMPQALAEKFSIKETKESPAPIAPTVTNEADAKVEEKPSKQAKKKAEKKVAPMAAKNKKEPVWPNRWTMKPFFRTGEKYSFDITYFGATAGTLDLELLEPKVVDNRLSYHIKAVAQSASVFSLFYRLNDVGESFLDTEGLFSHKFSMKLDESLQQRDLLELYDQQAHKVYYWSKLDHKKKGKRLDQFDFAVDPYAQDGLSAFFYLRTLPLKDGESYRFPVVTNGKPRTVQVTVVRRETLKTKIGEKPAIVIKPEVVLDGVLQSQGDSFVWLSDDEERIILKIDAKIKIGSVIGYLRKHSYGDKKTNAENP